jgi:NADPH:quinone reductase-like Zn-dependent oxidoreductase
MTHYRVSLAGCDIAGIVTQVPIDCEFKIGDQVIAFMPLLGSAWGSGAEYASILPEVAVKAPVCEVS